mgnify:CR=1 FL=1
MEPRKRGRPKQDKPTALHKRTMAFPPDLYARLVEIAAHEERDVSSQIIKVLRDFVARHDREAGEEGQLMPAAA